MGVSKREISIKRKCKRKKKKGSGEMAQGE
jgi:hypothetical protein